MHNNITFYEWEPKKYEDFKEKIKEEKYFEKLEEYLEKNKDLKSVFSFSRKEIKAQNYVGVIKYKNISFSILPKISKNETDIDNIYKNLIYMLSVTKQLNIKITNITNLSKTNNSFLEILIRYFAETLFNNLKKSSINNYIREEDNLNCVKGKINWTKNIKYNYVNKAKTYCEYDEFSENNLLNQLFLFVSKSLYYLSNDSYNRKILLNIINYYINVDFVIFNIQKAEKIKLTRNQELFKDCFNLAKMFIENSVINLSNNKIENISIIWDMNILFEEFIYVMMKKYIFNHKEIEYKINYQKGEKLFKECKGIRPETYSDIVLTNKDNKKVIIIDTKYKQLTKEKDNKLKYSNDDLYQVITYCLINKSNNAILLYPKNDRDIEEVYGIIKYQENIKIDLKTINIKKDDLKEEFQEEIVNFLEKLNSK